MDVINAEWLKARLTGTRGELKALADAVNLSPDKITKILKGDRTIRAHEIPLFVAFFAEAVPTGLEESESAYIASSVAAFEAPEELLLLAKQLNPDARHPMFFRQRGHEPGAAALDGDILFADLKRDAVPGDLVIATISTDGGFTFYTALMRYAPPYLVQPTGGVTLRLKRTAVDQTTAVLGVVTGLLRR